MFSSGPYRADKADRNVSAELAMDCSSPAGNWIINVKSNEVISTTSWPFVADLDPNPDPFNPLGVFNSRNLCFSSSIA